MRVRRNDPILYPPILHLHITDFFTFHLCTCPSTGDLFTTLFSHRLSSIPTFYPTAFYFPLLHVTVMDEGIDAYLACISPSVAERCFDDMLVHKNCDCHLTTLTTFIIQPTYCNLLHLL
jgi:hypothetical protein